MKGKIKSVTAGKDGAERNLKLRSQAIRPKPVVAPSSAVSAKEIRSDGESILLTNLASMRSMREKWKGKYNS